MVREPLSHPEDRTVMRASESLLKVVQGMMLVASLAAAPDAAEAAAATYTCKPDSVVSANVRVVAHCAVPYSIGGTTNIFWFAYPASDPSGAARMISLFEAAYALGSNVTFYFDTADTSGTAFGCLAGDCRAIWAATMP
jgi:hypothetical protein